MTNSQLIGKAYGFFYCKAPKDRIEAEFEEAMFRAQNPPILELELKIGIHPELDFGYRPGGITYEPQLVQLAEEAKSFGNNYTIIATLPKHDNERTAGELGDLFIALYNSSLHESFHMDKDEPTFTPGLAYKNEKTGIYEIVK